MFSKGLIFWSEGRPGQSVPFFFCCEEVVRLEVVALRLLVGEGAKRSYYFVAAAAAVGGLAKHGAMGAAPWMFVVCVVFDCGCCD